MGAQQAFVAAQASFINVVAGYNIGANDALTNSGQLSDELTALDGSDNNQAALDARYTVYSETVNGQEIHGERSGDLVFQYLLYARSQLLLPVSPLVTYEPAGLQSLAGEAYALAAYTELDMAEDYCPGVTLDHALPGSGLQFGTPLSTDSLFGDAIGHFDSALKYAYGNDTVNDLASIGLGRAWLDRDSLSEAARAVAGVPLGFVYDLTSATFGNKNNITENIWAYQGFEATGGCCGAPAWKIADRDGGVGINYISAHDARLSLDSSGLTQDASQFSRQPFPDSVFYYPLKFGPLGQSTSMPIATGVEAALIAAEAADSTGGTPSAMLTQLQAIRQNAAQTYLQVTTPLPTMTADSLAATGVEAISILFRERAFWLFGLGTRLGDMRREVRQYNNLFGGVPSAVSAIYPNGPYAQYAVDQALGLSGLITFSTYGSDIDMPLPTQASYGQTVLNPAYKGCTQATTVP